MPCHAPRNHDISIDEISAPETEFESMVPHRSDVDSGRKYFVTFERVVTHDKLNTNFGSTVWRGATPVAKLIDNETP